MSILYGRITARSQILDRILTSAQVISTNTTRMQVCVKEMYNYQGWILKKIFSTSRAQLRLSNISSQRILVNFESKSWTLWRPSHPQVWRCFRFRQNEEMGNTHWPRNIQEVFEIVTLFFLQIHKKKSR